MKAFLQLIRIPNVFTVVADILMGYLFVHSDLTPLPRFLCILLSSIALYWSGMVLNDLFDVEQDRVERPERPLPSGRISMGTARVLGWGWLIAGVGLGWIAGWLSPQPDLPWRSGAVVCGIAVCILLYDGLLKRTVVGPLLMGACRTGNILLGMSTGAVMREFATPFLQFDAAQLAIAGGMGMYVAGVTWFARGEAQEGDAGQGRGNLLIGAIVMIAGLVMLTLFTQTGVCQTGGYSMHMKPGMWPFVVLLLAVPVIRRLVFVLFDPSNQGIQSVVVLSLQSLIVFDAAICLMTRSPWYWSLLIICMIVPAIGLGRRFYVT